MPAIPAGHLARDPLEVEHGTFRRGILRDDIPIELDRIVNNGGKLADYQVDLFDFPRACIPESNIKNILGNRKLMHIYL